MTEAEKRGGIFQLRAARGSTLRFRLYERYPVMDYMNVKVQEGDRIESEGQILVGMVRFRILRAFLPQ